MPCIKMESYDFPCSATRSVMVYEPSDEFHVALCVYLSCVCTYLNDD